MITTSLTRRIALLGSITLPAALARTSHIRREGPKCSHLLTFDLDPRSGAGHKAHRNGAPTLDCSVWGMKTHFGCGYRWWALGEATNAFTGNGSGWPVSARVSGGGDGRSPAKRHAGKS